MERNLLSSTYLENCANYYNVIREKPDPADRIPHQKDYYEVCFVQSGILRHRHENLCLDLEPGDCFVVPPGYLHNVEGLDENTCCYWLFFQESLFFPGDRHSNVTKLFGTIHIDGENPDRENALMKISLPPSEREHLRCLFECLLYECRQISEQDSNASLLIVSALSVIARNCFEDPAMEQQLDRINAYNDIIRECIRYIDENYMRHLTIAHMAKHFAISPSSFSIMFPKIAGTPFKQYLNRKRINAAVALCADQSLPFHKIAVMCGYQDTSTFYRNFIKYMGISPSSFRTQLQTSSLS